jgi:hypothetical protein
MGVMRHAALHVQGQFIIWQQVFMKLKDTHQAAPLSKGKTLQTLDAQHSKK